ncbi:PREDICTED: protein phosphatase 1 regulatory subunit 37 [Chaetura pelagica]|uniref:protein phosphatase 1 regulatory subunit 37 n=1 Tax=Chaetura pelagica TaxID=8897 RepID=UPI0005231436|nr:PREDICTED: protein phosphatase 1 regulatory subunit 37 [Chaetura pelagica]
MVVTPKPGDLLEGRGDIQRDLERLEKWVVGKCRKVNEVKGKVLHVAQNVTVEEIMLAYKQACQKLNCKQIPKLLRQIQEFQDLAPRIDCLDLKGEKLDSKACEALEEIFKRVQFKLVDLEQTSLDEDGASALFDMIEYYESATHLNISFNKHIGTRGWQAAAHMMRKVSAPTQLLPAGHNTPWKKGEGSPSHPPKKKGARVGSRKDLGWDPKKILATALKMNMNLRELYLADNKLNGLQDSAQLGNLLKFNCYIQILDLRNNHILDSGLAYICEGLKEQRKGLVTLVLWNNQLTHTGMAYLGMTLPHTQSLETLNLGHNPIGNEGVRNLKNGLIGNRSVLRLGLASTKLTCEGAVAVAEFIAESPRLLRLDLRENEIKTGGLMALSLALKVNHSLLRLDLDREPKKEAVKSFIETQKALLAEIQNGCKRNFILAKEKEEKEQKLQQSASMPEITMTEALEEPPAPDSEATTSPQEGEGAEETPRTSENGATEPMEEEEEEDGGDVSDSESDTDEEEGLETKDVGMETKDVGLETKDMGMETKNVGLEETEDVGSENKDLSERSEHPDAALEKPRERPPPLHLPRDPAPSQGNERRISVSSPGRGHKIFVVTRVESLPEPSGTAGPSEPREPDPVPALRVNGAVPKGPAGDLGISPLDRQGSNPQGPDPQGSERAACGGAAQDTPLPNGLKTDFVRALPEASEGDGKTGNCGAEHELSCSKNEQELEELLLEASQDTGQELL